MAHDLPRVEGLADRLGPGAQNVRDERTRTDQSNAENFGAAWHFVPRFRDSVGRTRGEWQGISVELVHANCVDCVARPVSHVVSVFTRACGDLVQSRNGLTVTRSAMPGDIIVTPMGAPKEWKCDEECEWIAMQLDPGFVNGIARSTSPGYDMRLLDNFGTRDAVIEDIGRRFVRELEHPGFASDVYGNTLAHLLAVHLLRQYSTRSARAEAPAKLPAHKLRRAREFIEAHLGEGLTVGRIADHLGMSADHFAHRFHQATKQAPHQFVMQRRVERAISLLRATDLPIIEVAYQVGCRSQGHFSSLFRRHTGLSPTQFRRSR